MFSQSPESALEAGLSSRPLYVFFVVDASNSMRENQKIETLNRAIREAIFELKNSADDHPNITILVRSMVFADQARWRGEWQSVDFFQWEDVKPEGKTAMGAAMLLLAQELRSPPMPQHILPPVVILLSDGEPTDDYDAGLSVFEKSEFADKAVRLSIAIGNMANIEKLKAFMSPQFQSQGVLLASNSRQLVDHVKWASVAASTVAIRGAAPLREQLWAPPAPPVEHKDGWVDFDE